MPYVSDAQRRYFHAASKRGDISAKTVHEFDKASKGMDLPEHVKKAHGGMIGCPKCGHMFKGGEVDADSGLEEGEEPIGEYEPDEPHEHEPMVLAMRKRR